MFCTHCGVSFGEAEPNFCSSCGKSTGNNNFSRAWHEEKLTRPREGRQVAGVCMGLANYLHMDVTLIRLAAVVCLVFSAGTMGIAYLIAMAVIPEESESPNAYRTNV